MPRRAPLRLPALLLLLTLCASLAVTLATAPAALAAGWKDGPAFATGAESRLLALGTAADGTTTAVWSEANDPEDPIDFRLRTQQARPDGSLLPVEVLAEKAAQPVAANGPDGSVAVVWVQEDATAPDGARVHRAQATPGGPVQRASTTALVGFMSSNTSHRAAMDGAGTVTLAAVRDGDDGLVIETVRSAADGTFGSVNTVGTLTSDGEADLGFGPVVAASPDGTSWTAWRDEDKGGIAVARRTGSGPMATGTVPGSAGDSAFLHLAAGAGGAAVTWTDPAGDEGDEPTGITTVRGVRLPPAGALTGAPFSVGPGPLGAEFVGGGHDVALGPDGTVTVAAMMRESQTRSVIQLSRIAPAAGSGPVTPISSGPGIAVLPTLSAAPDGAVLAAWLELSPPGTIEIGRGGPRRTGRSARRPPR